MTLYVMFRPPYPTEFDVKTLKFTLDVERVYLRDVCRLIAMADDVVAVDWPADEFLSKACRRVADKARRNASVQWFRPGDTVIVVLPRVSTFKFLEEPSDENARYFIYRVGPGRDWF